MSSQALIAENLRQKDSERSLVEERIQELREYEKLGYSGSLRIEILDVSPTEGDNCIIKLFSTDSGMQPPEINGVTRNKEYSLLLKDKSSELRFFIDESDSENETKLYSTCINIAEIPEDTALKFDLEAMSSDESKKLIALKASFDPIRQSIESKEKEIDDINKQINEIASSMKKTTKSSKKTSSDSKTKKAKGGKKKLATSEKAEADSIDSEPGYFMQMGMIALQKSFEHKAVFLFGVAVALIHYYGEYASV